MDPSLHASHLERRKVLVVDDDSSNALLSQIILERLGYEVRVCASGVEAEVVFRAMGSEFAFVASDYSMTPINGLELAERLLAIEPRAVVLVITGYDHPALFMQAERMGIHLVSPKPTTAGEFLDILHEMGL